MTIDLILTGPGDVTWTLGSTHRAGAGVTGLIDAEARWIASNPADAVLFWDPALGTPDEEALSAALNGPSDVYHAGLILGMEGLPVLLDTVHPTWPFNRDPSREIEATSWRVSLRACLVRTSILRELGFLRPEFDSVEGAGLEWGHRLLLSGALMRHAPWMLGSARGESNVPSRDGSRGTRAGSLPFADELRFVRSRFGQRWTRWAAFRAAMTGQAGLGVVTRGLKLVRPMHSRSPRVLQRPGCEEAARVEGVTSVVDRVSVIIATVDRYPYLRTLLGQLSRQTIPAMEIIVVDQTPVGVRERDLSKEFPGLPMRVIHRDTAGQCSSRNAGLEAATGEWILFLDDDVEVPNDLIEAHLRCLRQYRASVSSGVAEEVGGEPLTDEVRRVRASDVFPAGNTMVLRKALDRSGYFDLAYEKGSRADADLGMRLYLAGELMVLNGHIQVLHHHAPSGGLRRHGARTVTRASSRSRMFHRNLPSPTELYLARRFFSERQVREMLWLRLLGTFSLRGNPLRRLCKVVVSTLSIPSTLWRFWANDLRAAELLRR